MISFWRWQSFNYNESLFFRDAEALSRDMKLYQMQGCRIQGWGGLGVGGPRFWQVSTVKDGRKITQNILGEHKVITTEQQFLGVILSFFMHLRWPWLLRFFT